MKLGKWKRALCLVAVALLCVSTIGALGESFPYVAHATDSVRLRARPSSSPIAFRT